MGKVDVFQSCVRIAIIIINNHCRWFIDRQDNFFLAGNVFNFFIWIIVIDCVIESFCNIKLTRKMKNYINKT